MASNILVLVLVLIYCSSVSFGNFVGINAGAQFDTSEVDLVKQSGAKWVRLNFIVGSTSGAWDPRFKSIYDSIVNAYINAGIEVYGLIGAEATPQGWDINNPDQFVDPFRNASVEIVQHFKDRVKVYEVFNEPNVNPVPPYWFARYLEVVYEQKYYRAWSVKLISGPLFSFDGTTAQDYLYQTYVAGMEQWAWDWFHQYAGTYPLDGIGYHIYVSQGTTDQGTIQNQMQINLNGIWQGVTQGENYRGLEPNPTKKLWISEIGWPEPAVGDQGQAQNLDFSYSVMIADSHVEQALWFTLIDFDSNEWGIIRGDGQKKSSWSTFQQVAAKYNH